MKRFRDLSKLVVNINAITKNSFLDIDENDTNLKETLSKTRQQLAEEILINEHKPSYSAIKQLSNRLLTEAITTCSGGTPHLYYSVLLKEWLLRHLDETIPTGGANSLQGRKIANVQFLRNLARGHFELWTRKGVAADNYHIMRAKELFELSFQRGTDTQEAHNQMMYVKILQFLGEIDKAIAAIQLVLHHYENDPEYPNYLFYAGGLYKALGDYDKASTYFFEASQIGPPKYFTKLDMMIIISRTLEQQQALQDQGESDEEDAYKMVHAHLILEGHLEEESEYEDWIGNARTWMHLGDKCALHHMFALATDLYGLAVMKDMEAFRKPMLWFRFAKACNRCGRTSDAQLAVKQALTEAPFNQQLLRTQQHWMSPSSVFQEAVKQPLRDIVEKVPAELDMDQKIFHRIQATVKGILERYQLRLGLGTRKDIHRRMEARVGLMIRDPLCGGRKCPILIHVSPSWLGKITHIEVYDVKGNQSGKVPLKVPFAPIKESGVPRKLELSLIVRTTSKELTGRDSPIAHRRHNFNEALQRQREHSNDTNSTELFNIFSQQEQEDAATPVSASTASLDMDAFLGGEEATELTFKFTDVLTGQYLCRKVTLKVQMTPANFSKYNLDLDDMQNDFFSKESVKALMRSTSTHGSKHSTGGGSVRRMDSIIESPDDDVEEAANEDGFGIEDETMTSLKSFTLKEASASLIERISIEEGDADTVVTATNIRSAELLREAFQWNGRFYLIRVINDQDVTQVTMLEMHTNIRFVFLMARENIDRSFRLRTRWNMLMELIQDNPLLSPFLSSRKALGGSGVKEHANPCILNGKHCFVNMLPHKQGASIILADIDNKPILGLSFELVEKQQSKAIDSQSLDCLCDRDETTIDGVVHPSGTDNDKLEENTEEVVAVPSYSRQSSYARNLLEKNEPDDSESDDAQSRAASPPSVLIRMSSLRNRRDSQSFRSPLVDEFLSGNIVVACGSEPLESNNMAQTSDTPVSTVDHAVCDYSDGPIPEPEFTFTASRHPSLDEEDVMQQQTETESTGLRDTSPLRDALQFDEEHDTGMEMIPTWSMVVRARDACLTGNTLREAVNAASCTSQNSSMDATQEDVGKSSSFNWIIGSEDSMELQTGDPSEYEEFVSGQKTQLDGPWIRGISSTLAANVVLEDTVDILLEDLIDYTILLYKDHILPYFAAQTARHLEFCVEEMVPKVIRHRRSLDSADCTSAALQYIVEMAVDAAEQSRLEAMESAERERLLIEVRREAEEKAAAEAKEKAQMRATAKAKAIQEGRLHDRHAYREEEEEKEEEQVEYHVTKIDSLRSEQRPSKRDSLVPVMDVKPSRMKKMPSVLMTEHSLTEFRTPSTNNTGNNTARSSTEFSFPLNLNALEDEDSSIGTSFTRHGAYFTSSTIREGEQTMYGDPIADPASPLPTRGIDVRSVSPAMFSNTAPANLIAPRAQATDTATDELQIARTDPFAHVNMADLLAPTAAPPPLLLPITAFETAEQLKHALEQWKNSTQGHGGGNDGLALHQVSTIESAMFAPYKNHAVTHTGGGRLVNMLEDDGTVSISNGSYDSATSPFKTVQRRLHPSAMISRGDDKDAGSVISNSSSLTDVLSDYRNQSSVNTRKQELRRKRKKKENQLSLSMGDSLHDGGSSVSSLRTGQDSQLTNKMTRSSAASDSKFHLNPIINITQDRERIKQEIADDSLHDIRKIGYVQRRPLPYATHWRDKLLDFLYSLPSAENLQKRVSTLLRTSPRALTIEEAVCALADNGGCVGEAVDRMQNVEFYTEIKLVCRTVHVRSMVCMLEDGERLFKKSAEDLSTPEIRSTTLAFKNASPAKVRLNPAIRDVQSGSVSLHTPSKNSIFVLMPSMSTEDDEELSNVDRTESKSHATNGNRKRRLSSKNPSFAAPSGTSRQLHHSDQHPFYGYQRSSGGAAGGMGGGTVEGNVVDDEATSLEIPGSFSSDSADESLYFWRNAPPSPQDGSNRILPPGMQSLLTLPSTRTSLDLNSNNNTVKSRATHIKLMRAASKTVRINHFLKNTQESAKHSKAQWEKGGFWNVNADSVVVVDDGEKDEERVVRLHPRSEADIADKGDMVTNSSVLAHQWFKGWSHNAINNVRLDPSNRTHPTFHTTSHESTKSIGSNQQQSRVKRSAKIEKTQGRRHADSSCGSRSSTRGSNAVRGSKPSSAASSKQSAQEMLASLHTSPPSPPRKKLSVGPLTGIVSEYPTLSQKATVSKANRVEGRIDQLIDQHGDETVSVMCRRDFLKAQQEQVLLKSDKKYIRDHIERKIAAGAAVGKINVMENSLD